MRLWHIAIASLTSLALVAGLIAWCPCAEAASRAAGDHGCCAPPAGWSAPSQDCCSTKAPAAQATSLQAPVAASTPALPVAVTIAFACVAMPSGRGLAAHTLLPPLVLRI